MKKSELYLQYGMNEYFDGDCFTIHFDNNLNTGISYNEIYDLLDKVCMLENLTPINNLWNEIPKTDFESWITEAFNSDIAFYPSENMPLQKAEEYKNLLLSLESGSLCKYFTNWFNPLSSRNGWNYNSITKSTLEMVFIILNENKIIFTYFFSED